MRHSDTNLTMVTYAHTRRDLSLEAMARQTEVKTGTDGPMDSARSLRGARTTEDKRGRQRTNLLI